MSLTSFLLQRAQHLGSKPALIDASSGRTLTYAQIADAIPRVAAGLARRGFQPKDVVAFCCPNLPEFAIAFHAVAMLGGITTTINPLYTVHEMNWQLNDSRAKCVITVAPLLE
ncbi:MAG TPA: AMP-binding protein, partial [Acidobacteriota bacterium]|nr:AMP-binding protein [Acidobacteriota bacterium]